MLRVLTLSSLFPSAAQPTFGVFVERQTLGLAALDDVEVEVVAPVGLPPWPLTRHAHYAARARLPAQEEWKGLTVHRPAFPVYPKIGESWTAAAMTRALLPLLRDIRERFAFDVIDAEFFWPDGPAAMRLAAALHVPFSIKARGGDINHWSERPKVRQQIVRAAHRAGGLLAVSAELRRVMASIGMPEETIAVHYTGVDLDRFRPVDRAEAKAALGVQGPLLVAAGALVPRKGQRLALEALAMLPEATLLLVGGGPDRQPLEAYARKLGVADRARFLGNRPHAELPGLLAAADLLVHPSASEGLANVWVEALACGTRVVTSDVGGAREVFDRPEAGRLVALDAVAIAHAVRDLLSEPSDAHLVRAIANRFSWGRNTSELRDHLARIVAAG